MALEINLLRVEKPLSEATIDTKNKITLVAYLSLVLFIIVSGGVLAASFAFGKTKESLNNRIDTATSQISAEKATESLYLAYANKLKGLEAITSKRIDANSLYKKILFNLPGGATLTSVNINGDKIDIETEMDKMETADKFLTNLRTQKDIKITEITMGGIEKSDDTKALKIPYTLILNSDKK